MNLYYGYARVSTKEQSDNSLEHQLKYLKHKAKELGMEFIPVSEKASGKDTTNRFKLQDILKKINNGDCLGVYDNSRLGRDLMESLELVSSIIKKGAIVQISGDIFDGKDPSKKFLFQVHSATSELVRSELLLKSKIGIEQKKEKGLWIFTTRLLGYKVTFEGGQPIVRIVEDEAEIIRYIFNEYAKGESIRKITKMINSKGYRTRYKKKFTDATTRRYLHKPIYYGYYRVDSNREKLVKSKLYPPIITKEMYDAVQKSYRKVRRKHTIQFDYRYSNYDLTSILKCYYCKKLGTSTSYVHNYHKSNTGKVNGNYVNRIHLKGCDQTFHTFRSSVLEKLFQVCFYLTFSNLKSINLLLREEEKMIRENEQELKTDIQGIKGEILRLEKKIDSLYEQISEPQLNKTKVYSLIERFSNEKKELLKDISRLNEEIEDNEDAYYRKLEIYSDEKLLEFINASSPAERRRIYNEIIESAYVYNGRIIIRLTSGKVFVIPLKRNRARIIQTEFDIRVVFVKGPDDTLKKRVIYVVKYDAVQDDYHVISTPMINPMIDSMSKRVIEQRANDEIEGIKKRIKELKNLPVN